MAPNPKPDHGISFKVPQGSVRKRYPNRVDWNFRMNFLKLKGWIMWIFSPNPISFFCPFLDIYWKSFSQFSESVCSDRIQLKIFRPPTLILLQCLIG